MRKRYAVSYGQTEPASAWKSLHRMCDVCKIKSYHYCLLCACEREGRTERDMRVADFSLCSCVMFHVCGFELQSLIMAGFSALERHLLLLLTVSLSLSLSVCLSVSVSLTLCLSVSFTVCLSPSLCLSLSLSVCLSVSLFAAVIYILV